jgi:hypothetical protein
MQLLASGLPTGIGTDQERTQATAWMRQQPWYQSMLAAWHIPPTQDDVKLNDEQRGALLTAMRAHGVGIPEGQSINENGQIAKDPSHLLRNIAIGAGIGALALTGLGAAGIGPLAGAFGGSTAAGEGGLLASEAIPGATEAGMGGLIAGDAGLDVAGMAGGMGAAGTAATAGGSALAGMTPDEYVTVFGSKAPSAIGTGSKIAGFLGKAGNLLGGSGGGNGQGGNGQGGSNPALTASLAAQAMAANRGNEAKIGQAGPASDAQAFRNAMRAGIVAKMDPQALSVNGHALPTLVNDGTKSYAQSLFDNLNKKQQAGQMPTEFGVAAPTQQETDLQNQALNAAGLNGGGPIGTINGALNTAGNYVNTGSRIAGLFNDTKSLFS